MSYFKFIVTVAVALHGTSDVLSRHISLPTSYRVNTCTPCLGMSSSSLPVGTLYSEWFRYLRHRVEDVRTHLVEISSLLRDTYQLDDVTDCTFQESHIISQNIIRRTLVTVQDAILLSHVSVRLASAYHVRDIHIKYSVIQRELQRISCRLHSVLSHLQEAGDDVCVIETELLTSITQTQAVNFIHNSRIRIDCQMHEVINSLEQLVN